MRSVGPGPLPDIRRQDLHLHRSVPLPAHQGLRVQHVRRPRHQRPQLPGAAVPQGTRHLSGQHEDLASPRRQWTRGHLGHRRRHGAQLEGRRGVRADRVVHHRPQRPRLQGKVGRAGVCVRAGLRRAEGQDLRTVRGVRWRPHQRFHGRRGKRCAVGVQFRDQLEENFIGRRLDMLFFVVFSFEYLDDVSSLGVIFFLIYGFLLILLLLLFFFFLYFFFSF